MAATVALALGAAVVWGAADFLGGLTARTLRAATVVLWVNAAGLVAATGVAVATGAGATPAGAAWAAAAGLVGGLGFVVFYAALSAGAMSIVAPVTACGALVPVVVAVAGGEPVALHVGAGMALALGGAVLAARPAGAEPHGAGPVDGGAAELAVAPGRVTARTGLSLRVLALAVVAALAIGTVLALLQQATGPGATDALAAVAIARGASLAAVLVLVAVTRTPGTVPRPQRVPVLVVGIADTAANALFALASEAGGDAVAAVLSSLYPITTVVLAWSILGERLSRGQAGGVLLALAGVALVSAR